MTPPTTILELVERFDRNRPAYRSGHYNERSPYVSSSWVVSNAHYDNARRPPQIPEHEGMRRTSSFHVDPIMMRELEERSSPIGMSSRTVLAWPLP